jgi:hypothetical protein
VVGVGGAVRRLQCGVGLGSRGRTGLVHFGSIRQPYGSDFDPVDWIDQTAASRPPHFDPIHEPALAWLDHAPAKPETCRRASARSVREDTPRAA